MKSLSFVINGVNANVTPAQVLADLKVVQALVVGNNNSWATTQTTGKEQGGWIYIHLTTGEFRVSLKTGTSSDSIILTPPQAAPLGHQIVADWHTHPGDNVAGSRPSQADIDNHKSKPYFSFVITFKKKPKSGWPVDVVPHIETIVDGPDHYIWNINP